MEMRLFKFDEVYRWFSYESVRNSYLEEKDGPHNN